MSEKDVATLYAGWPVERLVRAAYLDRDDYAPDAVQIMRRVLAERGCPSATSTRLWRICVPKE